jgi:hypothetical protein
MLGPKVRQRYDRQLLAVEEALLPPSPWRRNGHVGPQSCLSDSWQSSVSLESDFSSAHTPGNRVGGVEILLVVVGRCWEGWAKAPEEAARGNPDRFEIRSFGNIPRGHLQEIYNFEIVLQVVKTYLFEHWPCRISDSPSLRHTDRLPCTPQPRNFVFCFL